MARSSSKVLITALVFVFLAAGGYVVYKSSIDRRATPKDQPVKGEVFTVQNIDISVGINGAGVITGTPAKTVIGVKAQDISKVKIGQGAQIWVSQASSAYNGSIVDISNSPRNTGNGEVYDVIIAIKNGGPLKEGATTEVQIPLNSKKNVLAVPAQALVKGVNGNEFVWVLPETWTTERADSVWPIKRYVKVGLLDERNAEIIEGLQENERIILPLDTPS